MRSSSTSRSIPSARALSLFRCLSTSIVLCAPFGIVPAASAQSDLTAKNATFTDNVRGGRIQMDGQGSGHRAFLALDIDSTDGIASGSDYLLVMRDGNDAVVDNAGSVGLLSINSPSLALRTQGQNRLVIDSLGRIALGTITPQEIFGLGALVPNGVSGPVHGSYPIARFAATSNSERGIQFGAPAGAVTGPVYLKVVGTGNRFAILNDADSEQLTVLADGKVGVGTSAPNAALDVRGGQLVASFDASSGGAYVRLQRNGQTLGDWGSGNSLISGGPSNSVGINSRPGYKLILASGNQLAMTVDDSTQNVGIGTLNPTQKLSVNGAIKAKEVIVETTGWPDHVFDEAYALSSLSEVSQHIKQHKHLPGIPSARQVAQEGVHIGEMQAKLLAKIEELTLHAIKQEERIQRLEAQLANIRQGEVRR
jgi:hypothetical protein